MSAEDKLNNTKDAVKGATKDVAGRVTGDKDKETEGRADRAVADLKQAGEKVKDAFKR